MTAWIIAIGRMLGLGTSAGLRPSLTLAVIGIMSNTEWGAHVNRAFSFLHHPVTIIILVVLALLESSFDKISKLDRLQDRLIAPYRLAGGAVAGAATIPFGWQGIVIGAALGLFASWFGQYTKHITRPKSVPSDAVVTLMSLAEDLATFLGSTLTLVVPYFGFVPPAASTALYLRTSGRRRAKYRRMRRQAAAGQLQRRMELSHMETATAQMTGTDGEVLTVSGNGTGSPSISQDLAPPAAPLSPPGGGDDD